MTKKSVTRNKAADQCGIEGVVTGGPLKSFVTALCIFGILGTDTHDLLNIFEYRGTKSYKVHCHDPLIGHRLCFSETEIFI